MQGWQVASIGLFGVILGVAVSAFWNWIDRRERYRVMTFEKRLKAHQEAFSWNQRSYHILASRDINKIRELAQEGRDWWNENALLLDKKSQRSMLTVFNSMEFFAQDIGKPKDEPHLGQDVWLYINENIKDITNGIGAEHLPRPDNNKIQQKETHSSFTKDILDKLQRIPSPEWIDKYLFPSLFVIAVLTFVALTLYASYQIPVSPEYTKATRAAFTFNSLAALIGLLVVYVGAKNRWITLFVTIAIELFVSGMFFELISLIEKAH